MKMAVQIPIRANVPAQTFDITLNDLAYTLTAKWNSRSEFWTLDIVDENGIDLLVGLCLKLGARLLRAFNLDIGEMIVVDDTSTGTEASLTNIGISTQLIYFTPDEIEAVLE